MIERTRAQRRQLARDNRKAPAVLIEVPSNTWPPASPPGLLRVLRSRDFLVQVFSALKPAIARLTVCRTELVSDRWRDGIEWDELQQVKSECGFGAMWAVEVYPTEGALVNDANMRHLWIVPAETLPFAWNNRG